MGNDIVNLFKNMNSGGGLSNIMNMIKGIKNPNEMLSNMAKSNPQVNMLLNTVKNGGNPKDMFYEIAKQKGVNPDEIIEMAKNLTGNNS